MSVVTGTLPRVLTTSDLLKTRDVGREIIPMVTTGFRELDELTGGMRPGQVWVVVGTPGQGRTTLLTQWATALAGAGDRPVQLVTPRESPQAVASRLLSRAARVSLPHLTNHRLSPTDNERIAAVGSRLDALDLRVFAKGEAVYIPEVDAPRSVNASAVVVDDADRVSGLDPKWVAATAATGVFVLLALPRHRVMVTSDRDADLDPTWADVADVVLEVRHRGLQNGALRPGEAEFELHYNRWGFTRTIAVQHQAHFSRFLVADPATGT